MVANLSLGTIQDIPIRCTVTNRCQQATLLRLRPYLLPTRSRYSHIIPHQRPRSLVGFNKDAMTGESNLTTKSQVAEDATDTTLSSSTWQGTLPSTSHCQAGALDINQIGRNIRNLSYRHKALQAGQELLDVKATHF